MRSYLRTLFEGGIVVVLCTLAYVCLYGIDDPGLIFILLAVCTFVPYIIVPLLYIGIIGARQFLDPPCERYMQGFLILLIVGLGAMVWCGYPYALLDTRNNEIYLHFAQVPLLTLTVGYSWWIFRFQFEPKMGEVIEP